MTEAPLSLIDRGTGWWRSGSSLYNVVTAEGEMVARWDTGKWDASSMREGGVRGVRGGQDVSNHYRDERTRVCGVIRAAVWTGIPPPSHTDLISDKLVYQWSALTASSGVSPSRFPLPAVSHRSSARFGSAALTRTETSRGARVASAVRQGDADHRSAFINTPEAGSFPLLMTFS